MEVKITSIYWKPTFTGQYLCWNFFSPQKRKTSIILTLTLWALAICFPERFLSELNKIKFILQTNGNPEHVIKLFMANKIKRGLKAKSMGVSKVEPIAED